MAAMSDAHGGAAPRACTRCLFVEGMQLDHVARVVPPRLIGRWSVDDDGVCSLCRAYQRDFDRAALDAERDQLLVLARRAPVVLALSGGKDSLSTLWIARRQLALDVRAVLLDNGFIPAEVVGVARAACARVDAPLTVARLDRADASAFAQAVERDHAGADLPCGACSRFLERALVEAAKASGAAVLLLGTNYFASWAKRPSAVTVSAGDVALPVLHLPYALGVTRDDVARNLEQLGATPVSGLAGSTNCRVPGLLRERASERGHPIELEDLLLEVLVGHVPRQQAQRPP